MRKAPNHQAAGVAIEAAAGWARSAEKHMFNMPADEGRAQACAALASAWAHVAMAINTAPEFWDEDEDQAAPSDSPTIAQ